MVSDGSRSMLCVLEKIQSMCIGEIAMGVRMDAEHIGQMIYEATGMNAEALAQYCKDLSA
jgi:hypothetical protein